MLATTVQRGDQCLNTNGTALVYTVQDVTTRPLNGTLHVVAHVRYVDGGEGDRVWATDTDVPLVRPTPAARTVWKYRIDLLGSVLPRLRQPRVLTVATQDGYPHVWVEHGGPDPDSGTALRFAVVATGEAVPADADYTGTVFPSNWTVFHIYRLADQ